jgi:hypothetical protein
MPASDAPNASASSNSDDPEALVNGWTVPLLRRAYDESGDAMRAILQFLADNAGKEVTTYDVADGVEAMKDWNSVAGALGAFGRRCSNRYGMKEQPWSWRFDTDDRVLMKMPATVAAVIKQVAAE